MKMHIRLNPLSATKPTVLVETECRIIPMLINTITRPINFTMILCMLGILFLDMRLDRRSRPPSLNEKKWIVVTRSSSADNLNRLALAYPDWMIVVVSNAHHSSHSKRIVHLTAADRAKLRVSTGDGYAFTPQQQRNLGYLYAIANGAEWIYDLTIDSTPYGKGLEQFELKGNASGIRFQAPEGESVEPRDRLFNPYSFHGRADLSYPALVHLNVSHPDRMFRLCKRNARASVQYSLLESDADHNSPYGTERTKSGTGFNRYSPAVTLAPGTFVPWHTLNALYHRSAFFTMFMPNLKTMQSSNIHRSLVAQKMLHMLGLTVAVVPPNARRSEKENLDELNASKMEKLLEEVINWECTSSKLQFCMYKLTREFARHGFWTIEDANQVPQWLEDLESVGYKFPTPIENYDDDYRIMDDNQRLDNNCRKMSLALMSDMPARGQPAIARAQKKRSNWQQLTRWCAAETNATVDFAHLPFPSAENIAQRHVRDAVLEKNVRETALIITNNWPWEFGIGHLQRMYAGFFAVIIFCGTYDPENINTTMDGRFLPQQKNFNYVRLSTLEMAEGYSGFYCLNKVAEMGLQNIKGYYMISDDVIFNHWFGEIDYDRVNTAEFQTRNDVIWDLDVGQAAISRAYELITEKYGDDERVQAMIKQYQKGLLDNDYPRSIGYFFNDTDWRKQLVNPDGCSTSDFVYVPTTNLSYYTALMDILFEARVFHEIAFAKFQLTVPTRYHPEKLVYLWRYQRQVWHSEYNANIGMLHAVKLSPLAKDNWEKKRYCETVIHTHYRMLFGES